MASQNPDESGTLEGDPALFRRIKRRFLGDWVGLALATTFIVVGVVSLPTILVHPGEDVGWVMLLEGVRSGPWSDIAVDFSTLIVPLAVPAFLSLLVLPGNPVAHGNSREYTVATRVRMELLSEVLYWVLLAAALIAGVGIVNALAASHWRDVAEAAGLFLVSTFVAAILGPRMEALERSVASAEKRLGDAKSARSAVEESVPELFTRHRRSASRGCRWIWDGLSYCAALLCVTGWFLAFVVAHAALTGLPPTVITITRIVAAVTLLSLGTITIFVNFVIWRTARTYTSRGECAGLMLMGGVLLLFGFLFMSGSGEAIPDRGRALCAVVVIALASVSSLALLKNLKFGYVVRYQTADATVRSTDLQLDYLRSFDVR